MKKRVALIGAGNWGKNHLRNLVELELLHSVLEVDESTIELRKRDFPGVLFTRDDRDIKGQSEIEGVVISTPAATHYRLTKEYLLAGKDVLVEKPLALTVTEGEELTALARQQQRILMVGHILQYHPAVVKLKELVDEGFLGQIRYIYSNRLNIGRLRTEENVLWSFAPHDISLILMLMGGEEPLKVSASGGAYLNPGIYDTTLTSLTFRNGVRSHIFVNWLHPFKEQKLVVVGSDKMAVFDDVSREKLFIYPHKIKWEKGKIPVAEKADFEPVDFEYKQPLMEELRHFVDCMRSRRQPRTDGPEAIKVLRVLEEAERSLKSL
jgi:UDP-2-acetamido-3-amino-2,3-dideoxy-glucuronate N-acetyltransferase